ncbi:hypothetical protein P0136_06170 [Lentisphaerota bacterium ZTH]|nr:hypothetical protein JYG24_02720 [Lentisphaerota bacterium]WET07575.1 hypothetical protein P0136_06170 [Lentisphaerota bacterium ZTH]
MYQDKFRAVGSKSTTAKISFAYGAEIQYDLKAHHLQATLPGNGKTILVSNRDLAADSWLWNYSA